MHVRRRVPLLEIVPLDTMLSKLRIAKLQMILSQVVLFTGSEKSSAIVRLMIL
jgi:hypothetical protein